MSTQGNDRMKNTDDFHERRTKLKQDIEIAVLEGRKMRAGGWRSGYAMLGGGAAVLIAGFMTANERIAVSGAIIGVFGAITIVMAMALASWRSDERY